MYHELVFHLDLATLAYHQHAQSLIFPFDPYYRRLAKSTTQRRQNFMAQVRAKFAHGNFPHGNPYRGPGSAQGWPENTNLDPTISRYDRFYPWRAALTSPEPGQWLLYRIPAYIRDRIAQVHMCSYNAGGNGPDAGNQQTAITAGAQNPVQGQNVTDHLYNFEGATGRTADNTTGSWGPMGCILDRQTGNGHYDVHIAFRGSRSGGDMTGRLYQGLNQRGNPDWVTDMDANTTAANIAFTSHGEVCRGFMQSVMSCIPTIRACLGAIHARRNAAPDNIYVTGHSLGGGLASLFASAMLVGETYGQMGSKLGNPVANWPWRALKLITYGSAPAGDHSFVRNFNSKVNCRRVVLSADPIVILGSVASCHVGQEVYITGEDFGAPPDYHDPQFIRERLIRKLGQWRDPNLQNIPAEEPWTTHDSLLAVIAAEQPLGHPDGLRHTFAGLADDVQNHYLPMLSDAINLKSSYRGSDKKFTHQSGKRVQPIRNLSAFLQNVMATIQGNDLSLLVDQYTTLDTAFGGRDLGQHVTWVLMLAGLDRNHNVTFNHYAGGPYEETLGSCFE